MALETSTQELHQRTALDEVKTEYSRYFEALQRHPRLLVGQTVPSMVGDGEEVLRDSADAKDWQDAVKDVLAAEIRSRAAAIAEDNAPMMQTLHSSVELFQNNPDLVPGTREFDREFADEFIRMAKPYEVRNDEKLIGFSIPVQPLINEIRQSVTSRRTAAKTPPAPPAPASAPQSTPAAQPPAPPVESPQAGISSKAGGHGEPEDFSTLFGSIGLPGLRI